jgi:hypothetical protein
MEATMKRVAAVVRPLTLPRECRMEPAPMKPMPGNDLRGDARVVAAEGGSEAVGEQGEHRRAEADKEISAQAGGLVLDLALEADGAAEDGRQHQAGERLREEHAVG